MEIKECPLTNASLLQDFIQFPSVLPYPSPYELAGKKDIAKELSVENEFFSHGEALGFLCYYEGKLAGRVLASIDHNLKNQQIGHFGYLEVIDCPEVTICLINAVKTWLKQKGKTILEGPVDLHLFNRYRLQLAGFDLPPLLAEPRSLPYYATHLVAAGLSLEKKWYSRHVPCEQLQEFYRFLRQRMESYTLDNDYMVTPVQFFKAEEELVSMYYLMMRAWEDNVSFSRIPLSEFLHTYSKLIPLTHEKLCLKAIRPDGQWVGSLVAFYNVFSVPLLSLQQQNYSPSLADEVLVYMTVLDKEMRGKGVFLDMLTQLVGQIAFVEQKSATFMLAMEEASVFDLLPDPERVHGLYRGEL